MSELRTQLEKVGERVRPPRDAFDRLERRRRVKQRNRRLAAGVIALVVAAAGSSALYVAFRAPGGGHQPAAGSPDDFHALWPEQILDSAQATQTSVDAGDAALQWRLQPDVVAGRFAEQVLGWTDAMPESCGSFDGSNSCTWPPGTAVFTVHKGCLVCSPTVIVELRQLVREGDSGIWSVTRVASPSLGISIEPGAEVWSGDIVTVTTVLANGTPVMAGYTYLGSCGPATVLVPSVAVGGSVTFQAAASSFNQQCGSAEGGGTSSGSGSAALGSPSGPGLQEPVNGYLFVFALTDPTAADGFDPLEPGSRPQGGVPIDALAAVAVRFVPGEVATATPSEQSSTAAGASSPGASSAPSACAPAGTAGAAGTELHLVAQNLAFDTGCLAAPAEQTFTIVFENRDAGVQHNVSIYEPTTAASLGASVFRGEIVAGPTTVTYSLPALPAGTYVFRDDVHPSMRGTLIVK